MVEANFSTARPHTLLTNTQHVPRQSTNIHITSVHPFFAVQVGMSHYQSVITIQDLVDMNEELNVHMPSPF